MMPRRCGFMWSYRNEAMRCSFADGHGGDHEAVLPDGSRVIVVVGEPVPAEVKERPPLGVMPRYIWLENRAAELARAIGDRIESGDDITERPEESRALEWAHELVEVLEQIPDALRASRRRGSTLD